MPRGIFQRTKEYRAKQRSAHKGQIPWNKGLKLSEQHKSRISKANTGIKSSRWKGSALINNDYWTIYLPHWPVRPVRIKTCIFTACMYLGRYLKKDETIHHIDEDKLNDKPENLYLFASNSEHTAFHNLSNPPVLLSNF